MNANVAPRAYRRSFPPDAAAAYETFMKKEDNCEMVVLSI
jgi:hypothetical protein